MKKLLKYIQPAFFLLYLFSCNSRQVQLANKQNEVKESKNIFGLYSYFSTGYNSQCESVKHSLQLNNDSSFIFKIYCYADSTSPFPVTIKKGKFTAEEDFVFDFQCADNTYFKIEILSDSIIKIIPKTGEEKFNYPFKKETTANEKF